MTFIDRTKAVRQHFLVKSFKKSEKTPQKIVFLNGCCVLVFYEFLSYSVCWFCTGHLVMVPFKLTYLHCLHHSFFENLFSLYTMMLFGRHFSAATPTVNTSCIKLNYFEKKKNPQKVQLAWRKSCYFHMQAMLPEGFPLYQFNLLQLVFSACVASVIFRPVLHHCVVILFWSIGIMDCMLITFKKGSAF